MIFGILFLDREDFIEEEGSEFTLKFFESVPSGCIGELTWFKGHDGKAVVLTMSNGTAVYLDNYCLPPDLHCRTSEKGMLNATTGELTIFELDVTDEAYFYYNFATSCAGVKDTGDAYEMFLTVNGEINVNHFQNQSCNFQETAMDFQHLEVSLILWNELSLN